MEYREDKKEKKVGFFTKVKEFFSNGKNIIDIIKTALRLISMISDMLTECVRIYYVYFPEDQKEQKVESKKSTENEHDNNC